MAYRSALIGVVAYIVVLVWALAQPAAQPARGKALSCEELRKRVDSWEAKATVPNDEIRVSGEVQRIDIDGETRHLVLCKAPEPTLLCIAEAAEERQVGDILIASGTPSLREHNLVVIEACTHQVP